MSLHTFILRVFSAGDPVFMVAWQEFGVGCAFLLGYAGGESGNIVGWGEGLGHIHDSDRLFCIDICLFRARDVCFAWIYACFGLGMAGYE